MTEKPKRTLVQNRAIHLLFRKLAEDLNANGLEMKVVLKPSYKIWWNDKTVKEHLWKGLQKAMTGKKSTTELNTDEVSKIYEQLAKMIGEKHGVVIDFPNANQVNQMQTYEKSRL